MDNNIYLLAAYSIAWIIIFLYVFRLFRSQKALDSQMDKMEKMLLRNRDFNGGNP